MKSKGLKQKSTLSKITVEPYKFHYVLSRNIKVYPVSFRGKWYIEVDDNGKVKRYTKEVANADICGAVASTIKHYYDTLTATKLQSP